MMVEVVDERKSEFIILLSLSEEYIYYIYTHIQYTYIHSNDGKDSVNI